MKKSSKFLKSKKGMTGQISKTIYGVIALVILIGALTSLMPTLQNFLGNLSTSGVPLAGLFARDGVIVLVIMAGILTAVVAYFFTKSRK